MAQHRRARWLQHNILPHEPWLRRYLARRWPQLDAEELVQDCMVKLLQVGDVGGIENPRAYLVCVARTLAVDRFRRNALEQGARDHWADSGQAPVATPDAIVDASARLARVSAALDAMPERRRATFVLRRLENLTIRVTAMRLGVSERTVEKDLHDALRAMFRAAEEGEIEFCSAAA